MLIGKWMTAAVIVAAIATCTQATSRETVLALASVLHQEYEGSVLVEEQTPIPPFEPLCNLVVTTKKIVFGQEHENFYIKNGAVFSRGDEDGTYELQDCEHNYEVSPIINNCMFWLYDDSDDCIDEGVDTMIPLPQRAYNEIWATVKDPETGQMNLVSGPSEDGFEYGGSLDILTPDGQEMKYSLYVQMEDDGSLSEMSWEVTTSWSKGAVAEPLFPEDCIGVGSTDMANTCNFKDCQFAGVHEDEDGNVVGHLSFLVFQETTDGLPSPQERTETNLDGELMSWARMDGMLDETYNSWNADDPSVCVTGHSGFMENLDPLVFPDDLKFSGVVQCDDFGEEDARCAQYVNESTILRRGIENGALYDVGLKVVSKDTGHSWTMTADPLDDPPEPSDLQTPAACQ